MATFKAKKTHKEIKYPQNNRAPVAKELKLRYDVFVILLHVCTHTHTYIHNLWTVAERTNIVHITNFDWLRRSHNSYISSMDLNLVFSLFFPTFGWNLVSKNFEPAVSMVTKSFYHSTAIENTVRWCCVIVREKSKRQPRFFGHFEISWINFCALLYRVNKIRFISCPSHSFFFCIYNGTKMDEMVIWQALALGNHNITWANINWLTVQLYKVRKKQRGQATYVDIIWKMLRCLITQAEILITFPFWILPCTKTMLKAKNKKKEIQKIGKFRNTPHTFTIGKRLNGLMWIFGVSVCVQSRHFHALFSNSSRNILYELSLTFKMKIFIHLRRTRHTHTHTMTRLFVIANPTNTYQPFNHWNMYIYIVYP